MNDRKLNYGDDVNIHEDLKICHLYTKLDKIEAISCKQYAYSTLDTFVSLLMHTADRNGNWK